MTSNIRLYTLGNFQSDRQIASLERFSSDFWEFGAWKADAFRINPKLPQYVEDNNLLPFKFELSHVLTDIKDNILAILIASQQRERYLENALDEYLYIHKVLIHPDLRGKRIDNQSVFGFLFDQVVSVGEYLGLYTQVLSVDSRNKHAINVYTHYEFAILAELDYGTYLMGRGFPDLSTESYFEI